MSHDTASALATEADVIRWRDPTAKLTVAARPRVDTDPPETRLAVSLAYADAKLPDGWVSLGAAPRPGAPMSEWVAIVARASAMAIRAAVAGWAEEDTVRVALPVRQSRCGGCR